MRLCVEELCANSGKVDEGVALQMIGWGPGDMFKAWRWKSLKNWSGMAVQAYNPSPWEIEAEGSWGQC